MTVKGKRTRFSLSSPPPLLSIYAGSQCHMERKHQKFIAMSDLSESELKILAIIPRITAALSMLGSCSILYDIWKDRGHKLTRPYYRILLGMSLFDLVSSIAFSLSTLPMPEATPFVYGARGTVQTCTAQGFFIQLMLGSIFYNFVLSLYYTLSGKYKISDEVFTKRYELYLHGAAMTFTLGLALGKDQLCFLSLYMQTETSSGRLSERCILYFSFQLLYH